MFIIIVTSVVEEGHAQALLTIVIEESEHGTQVFLSLDGTVFPVQVTQAKEASGPALSWSTANKKKK